MKIRQSERNIDIPLLVHILSNFALLLILLLLEILHWMSEELVGIITTFLSVFFILHLFRKKLIFSPMSMPAVFLFLFGIYQLKLRLGLSYMGWQTKLVILSCIMIWLLISVFLGISDKDLKINVGKLNSNNKSLNTNALVKVTFFLAAISICCMAYEWIKAGGIPILSGDAETSRITVSINGITHTFAIMIKIVAVIIGVYWITEGKGSWKKNAAMCAVMFFAIFMMLGTSNRGELIFIPAILFIVYGLTHKLRIKNILLIGTFVILVLAVYPIFRGYLRSGESFFTSYKAISRYPSVFFLTPLYDTLTFSFEILNKDISTFPALAPFGKGQYTFFSYIPFLDLGNDLGTDQNLIWQNGFYGTLTSTYLGNWYADFGYFGCFLGTMIFACFNCWLYKKWILKNDILPLILYAYTFYLSMVGVYSYAFNFVYFCYCALIILVFQICRNQKEKHAVLCDIKLQ